MRSPRSWWDGHSHGEGDHHVDATRCPPPTSRIASICRWHGTPGCVAGGSLSAPASTGATDWPGFAGDGVEEKDGGTDGGAWSVMPAGAPFPRAGIRPFTTCRGVPLAADAAGRRRAREAARDTVRSADRQDHRLMPCRDHVLADVRRSMAPAVIDQAWAGAEPRLLQRDQLAPVCRVGRGHRRSRRRWCRHCLGVTIQVP